MSVAASKHALRTQVRRVRKELAPEEVRSASARIQRRVADLAAFKTARVVGCYVALPHEVQTAKLMEKAWASGKKVCVPARETQGGDYRMAWLERGEATARGSYRIPQPAEFRPAPVRDIDLVIVPAVAFDRRGRRLGHGGGHYDRLLAGCRGLKVGLAFEVQIVDSIPTEHLDIPVDLVVTEQRIYPAAGQARGGCG